MAVAKKKQEGLSRRASGPLSKPVSTLTVGAMEAALRLTGRLDEASVAIAAARAEGGSISYDEPVDLGVYDAMLEGVS